MRETLELTVAELDCADEAQQIQRALGSLAAWFMAALDLIMVFGRGSTS